MSLHLHNGKLLTAGGKLVTAEEQCCCGEPCDCPDQTLQFLRAEIRKKFIGCVNLGGQYRCSIDLSECDPSSDPPIECGPESGTCEQGPNTCEIEGPVGYESGPLSFDFTIVGSGTLSLTFSVAVDGCANTFPPPGEIGQGEPCERLMTPEDGIVFSLFARVTKEGVPETWTVVAIDDMTQTGDHSFENTADTGGGGVTLSLEMTEECAHYTFEVSCGVQSVNDIGTPTDIPLLSESNNGLVLVASLSGSCDALLEYEDIDSP